MITDISNIFIQLKFQCFTKYLFWEAKLFGHSCLNAQKWLRGYSWSVDSLVFDKGLSRGLNSFQINLGKKKVNRFQSQCNFLQPFWPRFFSSSIPSSAWLIFGQLWPFWEIFCTFRKSKAKLDSIQHFWEPTEFSSLPFKFRRPKVSNFRICYDKTF